MTTTICQESDLPPILRDMLSTLRSNATLTPAFLSQWAVYFDKVCPIVGEELHLLSARRGLDLLSAKH